MNVTHDLSADQYLVTHAVGPNQSGIRLDAFLKDRYRKRSREILKKAIESGAITLRRSQGPHVAVGRLKPSYQLLAGDEVLVLSERRPEPEVSFDYRVVFEDQWLFVIDKPANLPVHPAGRYFFNTLLIHLKTQGHKNPLNLEREYFLVHRIDKETSGILVLVKDKAVCTSLTRQFAARTTEKRYFAVTHGISPEEFKIDLGMKRSTLPIPGLKRKNTDSAIGLKMVLCPEAEGGQSALTSFKRLETSGNYSLVECTPKTGRQHQIRLHLEAAGHPIVGDKLYGIPENEALRFFDRQNLSAEAEAKLLLPRHALHSAGITFEHPISRERLTFRSALPQDLRKFLDAQKPAS